jgi:hypothetical protein
MPVTRHFYESEEVVEALRWSVVRGRVVEAAFWCEELVCSGEEGRAWGALFSVWMEQALIVTPDWADVWFGVGGDIQEACAELCHVCKVRRDISLPLVLLLGRTGAPPESVPALPASHPLRTGVGGGGRTALYNYFERACVAGKAQAAWWAAQQLGHTLRDYPLPSAGRQLFDYLERLTLPGNLDSWRAAFMCAAVLLECEGHLKPFKSLPKRPTGGGLKPATALGRWEGLEGRRGRREFAIPREALLCVTERGRMRTKESSLSGLYRVQDRLEAGEGCAFWTDTLANYVDGESGGWATEEAQEAFYEFAFPDDIPDEWSKLSQAQSHGPGCLSSTEEPRWAKWGRLWLDADAVFAWGIPAVGLMESLVAPAAGMGTWLDALFMEGEAGETKRCEDIADDAAVLALLTPVRKMLIVE